MNVLVTGGTGYVGSHTVQALLNRGHTVRMLVRSPDRVGPALEPLGVAIPDDIVQGDVTDPDAVARALDGCDAVVHAASIYTLDVRRAKEIRNTNVQGTRNVLGAALERGLDPVVHVSSYVSLVPFSGTHIAADSPVGKGMGPYSESKAESERVAREFQAQGKPVVTILPGSVWGSYDPYFGESHQIATDFLKGKSPLLPSTGALPIVDVRDVAQAIAAAIEPGRGPRAYLLAGHVTTIQEMAAMVEQVTDRKLRRIAIPATLARMGGPFYSGIQRIAPWRLALSNEALKIGTLDLRTVDDENVRTELGVHYRPLEESMRSTVECLVATGRLGKEAGVLSQPANKATV